MSGPAVPAVAAAARLPAIRFRNHVLPVLIAAGGMDLVLWLDLASFVVALASVQFIRLRERRGGLAQTALRGLDRLRFLRPDREARPGRREKRACFAACRRCRLH